MDDDALFASLARQRSRLADRLGELDPADWDVDSWCDGWRVRDVVGHLVSLFEVPLRRFIIGSVRTRGFDPYAATVAVEFGARSSEDLVADVRKLVETRKAPPVLGPISPVVDTVVHTADILGPIGRLDDTDAFDPEAARASLHKLTSGKARMFVPGDRCAGLRFVAADLDWSAGAGPVVEGPSGALAAAISGREQALSLLDGDGVAELTNRVR